MFFFSWIYNILFSIENYICDKINRLTFLFLSFFSLFKEKESFLIEINRLSIFLESSKIELVTTKPCIFHISWLISEKFLCQSSICFPNFSLVEWFRLIELFSILGSCLISMNILFSCPACCIPQCRVHNISRTIINQRLFLSIYVGLVLKMLVDLYCSFLWEFFCWISWSINWTWLYFWIYKTSSESCLAGSVVRMVIWMCLWFSSSSISSRSCIKSLICFWNMNCIKSIISQ